MDETTRARIAEALAVAAATLAEVAEAIAGDDDDDGASDGVAVIEAEAAARVAVIEAEAAADLARIQAHAEADADRIQAHAEADAETIAASGEADAERIAAEGDAAATIAATIIEASEPEEPPAAPAGDIIEGDPIGDLLDLGEPPAAPAGDPLDVIPDTAPIPDHWLYRPRGKRR